MRNLFFSVPIAVLCVLGTGCGGSCFQENPYESDAGNSPELLQEEGCEPEIASAQVSSGGMASGQYSCQNICSTADSCSVVTLGGRKVEIVLEEGVDGCIDRCNLSLQYESAAHEDYVVNCLKNNGGLSCKSVVMCAMEDGIL